MSSSEWKEVALGDICVLNYGKALTAQNRVKGCIPVYSSSGITGWHNKALQDTEGVIIGRKGSVGTVYFSDSPFFCIDTAYYIKLSKNYDLKYMYYRIKSLGLENLNEDSAVPGLNRDTAYNQKFRLPPILEQKRIAATLSCLDDKIEYNKKINHHLEQMVQAIFKSWFVNFEPWDGYMPEGWKFTTLAVLCSLIAKGITPKYDENSTEIVINQKCIRNKAIDLSLARRHQPKRINEKWLRYGDILINSTGEGTLGRAAQFFLDDCNYTVDSHITIVRPIEDKLVFFLGQWCLQREGEFAAMASGSTGQTDLPRERLKAMECLLPDDNTLHRFSQVLKPVVEKQLAVQIENSQLSTLRDSLLPRLMSGELSVADIDEDKL